MHDVLIIGAGIVGCAAARALSRYALNVVVAEKGADVSVGASKANSGILHAGYDCAPGTRKAKLNVQGLHKYGQLVQELAISCRINGSLVVATEETGLAKLRALYEQGMGNGVADMEIIDGAQARALEPNLHASVVGALRARTAGIISPYGAAIALAENAAVNGVVFSLETCVLGVEKMADGFAVRVRRGGAEEILHTRTVINAAGVNAGAFGMPQVEIQPQRGQYYLLDNTQSALVSHTIFPLPTQLGKGVLIAPTVDGNVLIGPTAENTEDLHDTATTRDGLQDVLDKVRLALTDVPYRDRIAAFAGVRAKHAGKDFIIEEAPAGFVHAMGIDSPGLTAAPAIADELVAPVLARLWPKEKTTFIRERPAITRFKDLSPAEQARIVAANPAYGAVVCRCETVTQAEIAEAVRRFARIQSAPPLAANLDAVKRRARAQMGRCQGGFCTLRIIELIAREGGISETAVTKDGTGSEVCPL